MATVIRFEKELTRESLESLRAEIDQLLALPTLEEAASGPSAIALRKVQALWPRIGRNSRRFLIAAAELGDYTFEDVASKLGVGIGRARAWHRNIARSLKQVDQKFGPEPPVLGDSKWDGLRNHYSMWMNVKGAISEVSGATLAG